MNAHSRRLTVRPEWIGAAGPGEVKSADLWGQVMAADFHNFPWTMRRVGAPPGKTNWRGEPRNIIPR